MFGKKEKLIRFITPLSVEECVQILNLKAHSKKPGELYGNASYQFFSLSCNPEGRNSFNRFLNGRIYIEESGLTVLEGKFTLHIIIQIFLVIFNLYLLAMALFILVATGINLVNIIFGLLIIAGMGLTEIVMFVMGKSFSEGNEQLIFDFIENELQATRC